MTAHDNGTTEPDGAPGLRTGGDQNGTGAVTLLTSSSRLRLILAGEVEVGLSAELTEAVNEARAQELPIDVDTRNVTFMDSSVIALLARLAYHRPQHRLRFIEPPDLVRFLLGVTQLGAVVDVVDHDPGFPDAAAPGEPTV